MSRGFGELNLKTEEKSLDEESEEIQEDYGSKTIVKDLKRNREDIPDDSLPEPGKGFKRAIVDVDDAEVSIAPEESWGVNECFPLRWLLCWLTPVIISGCFKAPEMKDLPKVVSHAKCDYVEERFNYIWPKLQGFPMRLMITINYCFGVEFWIAGIIQVISSISQVFLPKIMQRFMELLFYPDRNDAGVKLMMERFQTLKDILPSDHEVFPSTDFSYDDFTRSNNWEIWVYLGLMAIVYCLQAWGMQYSMHISTRVGMKVRTLVVSKVYQKSLRMSNKSRAKYENGIIMNHVSMDAVKIERIHLMLHYGWTSWIVLIGSIYFLADLIDWGALSGTGTNFLVVPIVIVLMFCFLFLRSFLIKTVDNRVNKTNEVLQSIRIIKFFSWEKSFLGRIAKIRFKEVFLFRCQYFVFAILLAVLISLTSVVCLVAFLTYFFQHGYLDAIAIFTSLTYFNMMRMPLSIAPIIIIMVLEMVLSLNRISKLLECEELEDITEGKDFENPIIIRGGFFRWEAAKKDPKDEEKRDAKALKKEKMKALIRKIFCCLRKKKKKADDEDEKDKKKEKEPVEDKDKKKEEFRDLEEGDKKGILTNDKEVPKDEEKKDAKALKQEKLKALFGKIRLGKKKKNVEKDKKPVDKKKKADDKEVNLGYLNNININVKRGWLTMVIGKVGSGKSSLLYAMLGEMKKTEGFLQISGSFAYTQQLSWVQNATLYENVVFGEEENEEKWKGIVDCCQLQQDLDELKGGRNIEIGEKGINLSGGQKYRVQLARACYVSSDIVLLDDPLAAVDAHVGKKIFHNCIIGYLKERTRVLVTHQLNYLKFADYIYLMDEGEIAEEGNYEKLMKIPNGKVAKLYAEYEKEEKKKKIENPISIFTPIDLDSESPTPTTIPESIPKKKEEESEGEGESDSDEEEEKIKKQVEIILIEETNKERDSEDDDWKNIDVSEDPNLKDLSTTQVDDILIEKAKKEAKKNCRHRSKKRKRVIEERSALRRKNRVVEEENKIIQYEEQKKGNDFSKSHFDLCLFNGMLWNRSCYVYLRNVWLAEWNEGTFNEEFFVGYHFHFYFNEIKDNQPSLKYFDPDDYPRSKSPYLGFVFVNITHKIEGTNITYYNTTKIKNPLGAPGGTIDCSKYGRGTLSNLPVDDYYCPSKFSWCGCQDQWIDVTWDRSWDNGTLKKSGIHQITSLSVYAGLGMLGLFNFFLRTFVFANFAMTAAKTLHNRALRRVLRAPMSFFDTTPIGRIISRFSSDITEVDGQLINSLTAALGMGFACSGMFFMIAYQTDGIGAAFVIPLLFGYLAFYLIYRKTNLELKRLEAVSRTPILSHISETLNGMSTIRAYKASERFITRLRRKIDINNRAFYPMYAAQRWLGVYLGLLGCIFVLFVYGTLIILYYYWEDLNLKVSSTALIMSYSVTATQMFFNVVQMVCESEVMFNSVERLDFYAKNVPVEIPFDPHAKKPSNFFQGGGIDFVNYSMRYRTGLDLVLKDLNFSVKQNERIGIVGRTGSGKSSLMVALWRICEPARGKIVLGGIDTKDLNLIQLRNTLAIIPQDATLFSGTIRSNLDPFLKYKDADVWAALKDSYMERKVKSLPKKLNGEVKQGGSNFSVGERQLLCLARALLRRARVLVLDEATASVDVNTDAKIQKTIRESFTECATLTIAHRLETIIDCDRILVMDDGKCVEYDTPRNLLENVEKYNIFRDLVHETGPSTESLLYEYAYKRKVWDILKVNPDEENEKKENVKKQNEIKKLAPKTIVKSEVKEVEKELKGEVEEASESSARSESDDGDDNTQNESHAEGDTESSDEDSGNNSSSNKSGDEGSNSDSSSDKSKGVD